MIRPRQLRIDYPGAIPHVVSRGDRREKIYHDDPDRRYFLKSLGETWLKTNWGVQRVRMPLCTLGCRPAGNRTASPRKPSTEQTVLEQRTKLRPDPSPTIMHIVLKNSGAAMPRNAVRALMACCHRQAWPHEGEQFLRSNIQCYLTGMHCDLASRDETFVCRGTKHLKF